MGAASGDKYAMIVVVLIGSHDDYCPIPTHTGTSGSHPAS
jgi:hypothetical protein